MDLGATLCTRRTPRCAECPVKRGCFAARTARQAEFPAPRPRRVRPQRSVRVLLVKDHAERILLERRPNAGIWGGLFSLPELAAHEEPTAWCGNHLNALVSAQRQLPSIDHAFTHFDLTIEPLLLELESDPAVVMDRPDWLWYKPALDTQVGLAAPIATLLQSVSQHQEFSQ
jgi:A/G-specific adenine glycosylase